MNSRFLAWRCPAMDEAAYREQIREQVRNAEGEPLEADKWKRIEVSSRLHLCEFNDAALFERLKTSLRRSALATTSRQHYLFYFAVPPDLFGTIAESLAEQD